MICSCGWSTGASSTTASPSRASRGETARGDRRSGAGWKSKSSDRPLVTGSANCVNANPANSIVSAQFVAAQRTPTAGSENRPDADPIRSLTAVSRNRPDSEASNRTPPSATVSNGPSNEPNSAHASATGPPATISAVRQDSNLDALGPAHVEQMLIGGGHRCMRGASRLHHGAANQTRRAAGPVIMTSPQPSGLVRIRHRIGVLASKRRHRVVR